VRNVSVRKSSGKHHGKKHSKKETAPINIFGSTNNPLLTGGGNDQTNITGEVAGNTDEGSVLGQENTNGSGENTLPVNNWKYGILLLVVALASGGYIFWKRRRSNQAN
jgi:hypothetical protein